MQTRNPKEVLAQYRKKGLGGRVGFGKTPAVLVVDYIVGFTDPRSPLAGDFDKELRATGKLLAAARRAGIPIFYTTTVYDRGLKEAGIFIQKVPSLGFLKRGTKWVEVEPRLKHKKNEIVIEKKYASAFFGTSLASTLTALQVDTLILAGCTTSGCIRASVVDALQHGFRPIVALECVGDRAPEPHTANLVDIEGKYGDVVELDAVLSHLEKGRPRRPRTAARNRKRAS